VHAIGVRVPEKQPSTAHGRRRRPWAAVAILGCTGLLFFCYLRIAGTIRVNSDAAGLVLQASDMLHGNLLLHGWWDTDVSFITTELPEYMGVTAVAGVQPEVVHICSALTYTLLVLLAAFVARGRARGAEGVVRALLAATVMLAPQPTGATTVLLGSPDHTGTALPVLLLLLLLDRAPDPGARARRYILACGAICVATAALFALIIVGDPLAEVVGVAPLVLACLLRALRISVIRARRPAAGGGERAVAAAAADPAAEDPGPADPAAGDRGAADTSWRAAGYQVLLAGAALAAVPVAGAMNSLIRRHHGYQLGPNLYGLQPWHVIAGNAPIIWRSFLVLFGADYADVRGAGNVAFALVHLAGVVMVIAAIAFAVWRLAVPARAARAGDLVGSFLVLAVLVNIAAYFVFVLPYNIYTAHEIGPVASLGAALTGRMLGGPLLRTWRARRQSDGAAPRRHGARILAPVLIAGLASYIAMLGIAAAYPQAPPQNNTVSTWLSDHHLSSGISSYWEASSITVNSGGKITMLAVGIHGSHHLLGPDKWETDLRLANAATHSANFVVNAPDNLVPIKLAVQMFGPPAHTYHVGAYTVMVWDKNLLSEIQHG
jgi:hypothetical protein